MNPEIEAQLSALIDGELSEEEARALRERARREPELAARLAELERVDAALRALPAPTVSAALAERMRARVAAERGLAAPRTPRRTAPRRRRTRWLPLAAAATAAAAALLALLLPRGDERVAPAPTRVTGDPGAAAPDSGPAVAPESVPTPEDTADEALRLAGQLEPGELAVVEVLDVLGALGEIDPEGGRG